ncbi:MAG: hypothetical protein AAF328_08405 [Planctomycetota bacterium]
MSPPSTSNPQTVEAVQPVAAKAARDQPRPQPGRNKFVTTVNLEPDVLALLGDLQSRLDRNRSYLVNALVRDFERRAKLDPQTLLSTFQPQLTNPEPAPPNRDAAPSA